MLADYDHLLAADPRDLGANVTLGQVYLQMRQYEDAAKAFRVAAEAEPYNVSEAYNLGVALTRSGQREEGQAAMQRFQNPYLFLVKQVAWALIGLAALPIVMRVDYRNYRQPTVIWTALAVAGLTLVAVLFAPRVNGATRWIGLGPLGIQPSELAKVAVILFMAALLERRMERIDEVGYSLLPIGIVLTFGYPERERNPEQRTADEWSARADRKPLDELVERL